MQKIICQKGKTLEEISNIFNVSIETVRRRIIEYFGKRIKELKKDVK